MGTLKQGMRLYIGGFAKLVILAQGNPAVKQSIEQMENATGTVLSVWILIITTTFGLYYTLTGYCDMARGLGCFFGLRFPENFHYPFQSRTVSDFFNRFNITVTQFINRYVYVFLGGGQQRRAFHHRQHPADHHADGLVVWHPAQHPVWGIYFAAFILLERYFLMRFLEKMPPIVDRIYTFIVVMFSFTIFSGSSLRVTAYYIKKYVRTQSPALCKQRGFLYPDHQLSAVAVQFFLRDQPVQPGGKICTQQAAAAGGFAGYRGVSGGVCSGGVILRLTICQREVDGYAFTQTTAGGKEKMLPGLLLVLLLGAGGVWALAAGRAFPTITDIIRWGIPERGRAGDGRKPALFPAAFRTGGAAEDGRRSQGV